jgi:hypothetical protein
VGRDYAAKSASETGTRRHAKVQAGCGFVQSSVAGYLCVLARSGLPRTPAEVPRGTAPRLRPSGMRSPGGSRRFRWPCARQLPGPLACALPETGRCAVYVPLPHLTSRAPRAVCHGGPCVGIHTPSVTTSAAQPDDSTIVRLGRAPGCRGGVLATRSPRVVIRPERVFVSDFRTTVSESSPNTRTERCPNIRPVRPKKESDA